MEFCKIGWGDVKDGRVIGAAVARNLNGIALGEKSRGRRHGLRGEPLNRIWFMANFRASLAWPFPMGQRPRLAAEAACAGFHHRAKIPARASIPAAWPILFEPRRQIRERFDLDC
jgi:hypothetical protein